MSTKSSRATEQIIAMLIMAWGVGWLGCYSPTVSDGWMAVMIAGGLGVTSIAVASSVWRSSSRAAFVYVCWAVADVLGLITVDMLNGEDLWKVALGGAFASSVLAVLGRVLVCSRRLR